MQFHPESPGRSALEEVQMPQEPFQEEPCGHMEGGSQVGPATPSQSTRKAQEGAILDRLAEHVYDSSQALFTVRTAHSPNREG